MGFSRFSRAVLILVLIVSLLVPLAQAHDLATERRVYEYLTDTMGLSTAAACGVLANIEAESGFTLGARGDGGTSYGLCQWHNARFDHLRSFCVQQGLDYDTLEGQMAYLSFELRTWYPSTYAVLRNVPNTPDGAYEAARYWCVHFESPADAENAGVRRGCNAQMKYWNRYGGETAISSNGYSGGLTQSFSDFTFYWEKEEPASVPVTIPAQTVPTEVPQETEEPQEQEPEPQRAGTPFRYIAHHSPLRMHLAAAKPLTPLAVLFLNCPQPGKRFCLPEPQEEKEPEGL